MKVFAESTPLSKLFQADAYMQFSYDNTHGGIGGRPERYWLPILALHTGARVEELCGLRLEDVVEEDGQLLLRWPPASA